METFAEKKILQCACPKVTVIILNWNGKEDTIECLKSMSHITYPNYKILIVDNGSTDNSAETIKTLFPNVEVMENEQNLGFAEGNNVGIKKALKDKTDYILLLNNDTVVDPGFLEPLVDTAVNNQFIGILGPVIYEYISPKKIQSSGVKINWNKGKGKRLYLDVNRINDSKFTFEVDYVSGCAFLVNVNVFKDIGYLDPNYFAYWEETDFCIRAKKIGYKVLCVPLSRIWHKGQCSTSKINGFHEYLLIRNRFRFMKKHSTQKQYLSFLMYFFGFNIWFSTFVYIFYHKNIKAFFEFYKGIIEGLRTNI
jgi:GT2 family glycosyltransferase